MSSCRGGDPTLRPEGLTELVRKLRNAGIERIEGRSGSDGQVRDVGVLTAQGQVQSYGPGAMILNRDRFTVHASANSAGERATSGSAALCRTSSHNLVKTVKGKRSRLSLMSRRRGQLIVTVRGRIGSRAGTAHARRRLGGGKLAEAILRRPCRTLGSR